MRVDVVPPMRPPRPSCRRCRRVWAGHPTGGRRPLRPGGRGPPIAAPDLAQAAGASGGGGRAVRGEGDGDPPAGACRPVAHRESRTTPAVGGAAPRRPGEGAAPPRPLPPARRRRRCLEGRLAGQALAVETVPPPLPYPLSVQHHSPPPHSHQAAGMMAGGGAPRRGHPPHQAPAGVSVAAMAPAVTTRATAAGRRGGWRPRPHPPRPHRRAQSCRAAHRRPAPRGGGGRGGSPRPHQRCRRRRRRQSRRHRGDRVAGTTRGSPRPKPSQTEIPGPARRS